MDRRIVQVFYGPGKGKTSAAVGQCIRAASLGQSVIIIQFLKGNDAEEFNFLETQLARMLSSSSCSVLKRKKNHFQSFSLPRKRKRHRIF